MVLPLSPLKEGDTLPPRPPLPQYYNSSVRPTHTHPHYSHPGGRLPPHMHRSEDRKASARNGVNSVRTTENFFNQHVCSLGPHVGPPSISTPSILWVQPLYLHVYHFHISKPPLRLSWFTQRRCIPQKGHIQFISVLFYLFPLQAIQPSLWWSDPIWPLRGLICGIECFIVLVYTGVLSVSCLLFVDIYIY